MGFDKMESATGITPDSVCSHCGLPVGQRGSFTYWIFKDNRCQCDDLKTPLTNDSTQLSSNTGVPPAGSKSTEKLILNQRYELLQCVGQGGMGFVYKGRDMATNDVVALKIMRPELARNELATKRVMREVEVVSRLSNSNLGHVYGYGQEKDGSPYLVMEFVEGRNLEDILITEEKLKLSRATDIFMQICAGLICAHSNGIIHRDIKPSNIIIQTSPNGQDRATIVDFGFAGLLRSANDSHKLTQEGEVFGSPAYMSPEQCLGEELDVRSDIYSLGCLMYEALTGSPPLMGENVLATVAKQIRGTAASMRSKDGGISEDIDNIVLKCLSKEPLHRYQSVTDLRMDLEKVKRGEHVKTSVKKSMSKIEQNAGERNSLRSTESAYGKMASFTGIVLVAAIVIGIGAAALAWMLLSKQQDAGTSPPPITPVSAIQNAKMRGHSENAAITHKQLHPSANAHALPQTAPLAAHTTASTHSLQKSAPIAKHAAAPTHSLQKSAPNSAGGWNQLKELRVYK